MNGILWTFLGTLLTFSVTTLGAAGVFFVKKDMGGRIQSGFLGFAGGVMIAASVWSLLIPAMDMSEHMGKFAFVPAAVGFVLGIGFDTNVFPDFRVGRPAPALCGH